ncbi:hypothetical protein [Tardiphaga sp.]|jgi:hypothetical protein|uniref:hypothetical protein n=1 Tax=Tardiphaga sp. TaxID=1926292 RepID=UPI0037D9D0C3
MSNQTDDEKAKKAADEAARKDAEAKTKADEKAKREAEAKAEADKKAAAASAKSGATGAKPAPSHDAPYPTQADLDAMKEGRFGQSREATADAKGVDYKTR